MCSSAIVSARLCLTEGGEGVAVRDLAARSVRMRDADWSLSSFGKSFVFCAFPVMIDYLEKILAVSELGVTEQAQKRGCGTI